jgi:hypothetical protein
LVAFLKSAYKAFSDNINLLFDFIQASQARNPIVLDLGEHLFNFLKYIKVPNELIDFIAPIILTSLLLDNYPPGAYYKLVLYRPEYANYFYSVFSREGF